MNNSTGIPKIKCFGGYAEPDIPLGQYGHDEETGLSLYVYWHEGWRFITDVHEPFWLPPLHDAVTHTF